MKKRRSHAIPTVKNPRRCSKRNCRRNIVRRGERSGYIHPSSPSGIPSDKGYMPLDTLVVNAGRLRILTALAGSGQQEFVALRESTKLTDGNLSSHARRLKSAGLIHVDKQFRAGKPVTTFTLTSRGRSALVSHVEQLMTAIGAPQSLAQPAPDDWVD